MEPAPKVLYSREEAARALALSLSTLHQVIGCGMLRTVHLGRRVLIHRDEIERCGRRLAQQDSASVWPEKLNGKTRRKAVA